MKFRTGLASIVVLTLAAISFVRADPPATEPAATEPAATQPTFTSDQRDALIAAEGQVATVTGTVSEIKDLSDRVMKISFADAGDDGFCGIIFTEKAADAHDYFETGDGSKLVDKKVTLSGKISLFRGNPEIIITDVSQVTSAEGATTQTQP
jgi:hypothetical protein